MGGGQLGEARGEEIGWEGGGGDEAVGREEASWGGGIWVRVSRWRRVSWDDEWNGGNGDGARERETDFVRPR